MALRGGAATLDLDATEVEVYGPAKQGIAYNYKGQRSGRPHVASWAEAGVVVAADLLAGNEDPRAGAAELIGRGVDTIRAAGVTSRPRVRGDVGYFAAEIARAAINNDCDFSLGVMRNKAVWRGLSTIPEHGWRRARRMRGAQVAVMDYAPAGWPPGAQTVVRRVKVKAATISTDPRARRRRTIPAEQLTLALDGKVLTVYAYSFIITNLDVSTRPKRSRWKPGTACAPTSRTASATPSTAPPCAICPRAAASSTRCGCGPPCWPSTCPPGCKSSAGSTTPTDAAEHTWPPCATCC
jgi:hypothetical protein